MSWAANEWKDGLPHRALQKIGEMEKTVEKMQKERQQRQFQMDSIEQVNLYKLYTIWYSDEMLIPSFWFEKQIVLSIFIK